MTASGNCFDKPSTTPFPCFYWPTFAVHRQHVFIMKPPPPPMTLFVVVFLLQQMLSLDRALCQWHQEAVSPFTVRSLAEGSSGVFYFKCHLYFILHVLIKLPTRTVVSLNSIRKQGHVHFDKGTGGSQITSLKPHSHG